ncbi:tektin-2 [Plutella xylostella]|uniref:tektin-2 n=1 Tax=Plutella xylostella TaxID=51655 RepID=UPI0020328F06|nr:tektin-2 [Plutella xylostella]
MAQALREQKNSTKLVLEWLQMPLLVAAQCHAQRNQRVPPELTRDQLGEELNKVCMAQALREQKNSTKLVLEWLQMPLLVAAQCHAQRDQRVPPELTRDQLGDELNKELHIIENSKRTLTNLCHSGWEKIKELTNVHCRLEREIKNKDETIDLESSVRHLDRNCSNISYKLDPTRIPAETMSEEAYIDCIKNTIDIAERLMFESKNLREQMFRSRETARNQMRAQSDAVEMIMRRRVFDVQRARNEMEWQKHKLEQNLVKVDREIESLRAAIADKINPTKLVETRLEMRTRRPVLERVNDKPMRGLTEEYERVHTSSKHLEQKLEDALKTYHGMQSHLQRVTKGLQYKNQALETDRRLVDIRKPIHEPDQTEFKRNVGYCHMSDELAPE